MASATSDTRAASAGHNAPVRDLPASSSSMTHRAQAAMSTNQANWNERAGLHAQRTTGYQTSQYDDPKALSNVVQFDMPRLPDLRGKAVVHLMCHIGTDTLSLSRLGAGSVTGLDFSSAAIDAAREIVKRTGDQVKFVVSNVYDATSVLPAGEFDVVYMSLGVLCWLPRIDALADVIAHLLKPGGEFFIRDGHPVLHAMDDAEGAIVPKFSYFETEEPVQFDGEYTYVDTAGETLKHTRTYEWNHGIGEIVTALIRAGLVLDLLEEHDSVPFQALAGAMVKLELDEWGMKPEVGNVLPLSYTIKAHKPK